VAGLLLVHGVGALGGGWARPPNLIQLCKAGILIVHGGIAGVVEKAVQVLDLVGWGGGRASSAGRGPACASEYKFYFEFIF
jgi:hypothetical protein